MLLPAIEGQPLPDTISIDFSSDYSTVLEYHELWKMESSNTVSFVQFLQNEGFSEVAIRGIALSFWKRIRSFFGDNSTHVPQDALKSLYALLDLYEVNLGSLGFPEPQEYFIGRLFAKMQTTDGLYDFFGSLFNKTLTRERIMTGLEKVEGSEEWIQKISDDFTKKKGRILQRYGDIIGGSMVKTLRHNPYISEGNL